VTTLARLVLLPIAVGMATRAWAPAIEPRLRPIASSVSTIALALVVLLAVAPNLDLLAGAFRRGVGTVSVIALVATVAAGWLIGAPERDVRVATSLVAAVRAVGPALAVALVSFAGRPPRRSRSSRSGSCPSWSSARRRSSCAASPFARDEHVLSDPSPERR
jgi:predicted Na+-dependent transporter